MEFFQLVNASMTIPILPEDSGPTDCTAQKWPEISPSTSPPPPPLLPSSLQLPKTLRILYIPWDFGKHAKSPGCNIIEAMNAITQASLDETGFYVHRWW